MVSKTTPDIFGGITGAEDGSALTASPVVGPWNDRSNKSINVLVGSGSSGHYSDDAIIVGSWDKLDHFQALAIQWCTVTLGGHQLKRGSQGLLHDHMIDAQGVQHLI